MSEYLNWIRSKKCGRCVMQIYPTEAHHLSGDLHQSGTALKADDFLAMPLCIRCHREFHNATWDGDRMKKQREILLLTLIDAYNEGILLMADVPEW